MSYEQDMRSFKGNRLNEQAKVLGIHPLTFMLIPLFVMIPYAIVKTVLVIIGIFAIFLSIKNMSKDECKRWCRKRFKRIKVVRSTCPVTFQNKKRI
jgi:hypothetical protein